MDGHYFVSYSRVDGAQFAGRLYNELVGGRPTYPVWLDTRDAQPGGDWDAQIAAAIQNCQGLLFVMTPDSVQEHSMCKSEWVWALKYKKPVIPLRTDRGGELPFRLSSREYVDFSRGFEIGLARLCSYLDSVGSPQGVLRELRDQLTEAERELPRADLGQQPRIEQDIADLYKRIADQQGLVADPEGAAKRTEERITAGLDQERHPKRPEVPPTRAKFVNAPPVAAPGYFQDRLFETELIAGFLRAPDERIMTVVGRGGVGKTAMVCRLLKALEGGQLPDDLGELAVDGIVYLSPGGTHPVNFPNLFTDLCRLLPQDDADRLMQRYRDPQQTPTSLMRELLDTIPAGRVVVLLDQAEDFIDSTDDAFRITDTALDEALRALLDAPVHGVKVIMTSRVAPRGLLLEKPERQRRHDLDSGLESPYAEQVLRARDPDGRLGLKTAPDDLLAQARERTRGYPRALEALAAILAADRDTTLPELLAETAGLPDNVVEVLVGQAFSRLDPLGQQVMQALAIFNAPVPPVAIDYLLQPYRPAIDAAPVLRRLVNMQFVRREAGRYYLHQVDRDYALSRIPRGTSADRETDPPPFTQQALLHSGADYFEQTRTPREHWKTLDDLAPLLSEYELRFEGEDYDSAADVLFSIDDDYLSPWGHYRLTIKLHERVQGRIHDRWTDGKSKTGLGWCYLMVGRPQEAAGLFQQAIDIYRDVGDRNGESGALGNLGLCYHDLGDIGRAIDLLQQAIVIDREIGNRSGEGNTGGNLGICLHDVGKLDQAIDQHQQGIVIGRDTGDRPLEASELDNLGSCYRDLGLLSEAVAMHKQAVAMNRELVNRYQAAFGLTCLANAEADLGELAEAAGHGVQAMEMADEIANREVQSNARLALARIRLLDGDLRAAEETVLAAREHPYLPSSAKASLLSGITRLRIGEPTAAAQDFRDAADAADELRQKTPSAYEQQDTHALALCGLAVTTDQALAGQAATAFRAARAVTSAAGIVGQVLELFDMLAAADDGGILAAVRPAAAGGED